MKKLFTLVLFIFTLPTLDAQIHLATGTGIVDDTQTINFNVGYTQFEGNMGIGANYRWTHSFGNYIFGLELLPKYKLIKNKQYELHLGSGAGWKHEEGRYYSITHVRNLIKVDPIWIGIDVETTFNEHYVTFVVSIPYFKRYRKPQRFF